MKRFLIVSILAGVLTGCAVKPPVVKTEDGLSASYPTQAVALGVRAAYELGKVYPAASTVVCVMHDDKAKSFALSLEQSLRQAGFAVASEPERASVIIGYQTDIISTDSISVGYWNLQSSDGRQFSLSLPLGKQ